MKYVLIVSLMMFMSACQSQEKPTAVTSATETAVKPEEDCDDKAKQKVEIKEHSISLTNPEAGCSLEEAQK